MSQDRRDRDFSDLRDVDVRGLRRDTANPAVVGYSPSSGGRPKVWPGDEKFPFIKDPPDIEGPIQYKTPTTFSIEATVSNPIPLVTELDDYLVLDLVDVKAWRLFTLYMTYFPGNGDTGVLSLVPRAEREDNSGDMYPVGVVDGTLTATALIPGGGRRATYATELSTAAAGISAPASIKKTLVFDVSTFSKFQILAGDEVEGSGLNLFYTLMR
jgi:hypothetical protein